MQPGQKFPSPRAKGRFLLHGGWSAHTDPRTCEFSSAREKLCREAELVGPYSWLQLAQGDLCRKGPGALSWPSSQ